MRQLIENMQNMYIVPSKLFNQNLSAIIKKSRKKMDSASQAENGHGAANMLPKAEEPEEA